MLPSSMQSVLHHSGAHPTKLVAGLHNRIWDKHVPPTFCQQRLQVFYLAATSAFIQRCSYEKQTPPGCHLRQRLQHIYTKFAHGSGVLLLVCSHIATCSCTWIYIGINKGCLVQQGKSVSYEKLHRGRNVFFTLSLLPPPPHTLLSLPSVLNRSQQLALLCSSLFITCGFLPTSMI